MSDEVPTSSWCTNWGAFNTPRLWAMVSDEDDPDAWRQVAAWGEVAGAVQDHRSQLVQARDALTAAWPPNENGAAQAFVTELNTLIARMDTARTDADTTATGLANILEALRTAKNQIQPLYEQYKDKNNDWVPNWWDNAEDDIDKQARAHMIKAEQTVEQHVAQLKVPDQYTMDPKGGRTVDDPKGKTPGGTGGGDSARSSRLSGSSSTSDVAVPHDPVPPLPHEDPIAPDGGGGGSGLDGSGSGSGSSGGGGSVGGPGLAGVITPPGTSPPIGTPPGTGVLPGIPGGAGPGGPGGPSVIGGNPMPAVFPGLGTGGGGLSTEGGGFKGVPGEVPVGNRPVSTRGALPSGAVIGESVGGGARGVGRPGIGGASGGGLSGRPAAGRAGGTRGASKPTPPSWLPEEEGGGARGAAAGSRGRPGSGTLGASGRGGRRRGDGPDQPQFDPDDPWQVAEGVEPVIAPTDDNDTHDPGPNVIGWRG